MTVASASSFIRRALNDSDLRKKLNYCKTPEALSAALEKENFFFSDGEFEEAYTLRLVKCQEADEAEQVKELQAWWALLKHVISVEACPK